MITNQPQYNRRAVWAWATYDFANSAFTTVVVTFIYATYFTRAIAPSETAGGSMWSWAISISAVIIALASPYLGALADRGGYRKRLLLGATVTCIAASVALFFPQQGDVAFALTVFVIGNVAFEFANVFYNAYLVDVAPPEKIGRISGYGWAMGYVGGLFCLVIALFALVQTDTPLFGFSKETGANVRASNLLVAVWFALFSIPMFLFVREESVPAAQQPKHLFRAATRQLVQTFHEIRQYRQVFRLLVARLIYNDGLYTIFTLGAIYAQGTFGFTTEDVIYFGIALNISAGTGAALFGVLDDRLGGKWTIMATLVGLSVATLVAVFTSSLAWFWGAGLVVGLLAGPNQSASRSLLGRFVPPDKENEFYGFFAFSGKATAFLGPLLFGILAAALGNQRWGIAVVFLFFLIGGLLLARVDEAEGIRLSGREAAA